MLGPIHGIRHNGSTREGLRGNLVKRTCELQLDRYNLIQLEHSRIKFDVCNELVIHSVREFYLSRLALIPPACLVPNQTSRTMPKPPTK